MLASEQMHKQPDKSDTFGQGKYNKQLLSFPSDSRAPRCCSTGRNCRLHILIAQSLKVQFTKNKLKIIFSCSGYFSPSPLPIIAEWLFL